MEIVFGDYSLGIRKSDVSYIFSYSAGGLDSLKKGGGEYLYRVPHLAFWRATTDNDRGSGFSKKSAMWMGADLFSTTVDFSMTVDGTELDYAALTEGVDALFKSPLRNAKKASITFNYLTATSPHARVSVTYSCKEDEKGLRVDYTYTGTEGLPSLPLCGLRFTLPFVASAFEWDGLSGETYPDRMEGAVEGHYIENGLPVCPYAMCQEYGMHMKTQKLLVRAKGRKLEVRAVDENGFNFSLLGNSPHEMEAAYHPYELAQPVRSYLTIAAAVRGVGGIDSWRSDVQPPYRLDAASSYSTSFILL